MNFQVGVAFLSKIDDRDLKGKNLINSLVFISCWRIETSNKWSQIISWNSGNTLQYWNNVVQNLHIDHKSEQAAGEVMNYSIYSSLSLFSSWGIFVLIYLCFQINQAASQAAFIHSFIHCYWTAKWRQKKNCAH